MPDVDASPSVRGVYSKSRGLVAQQEWAYDKGILSCAFNNVAFFIELGGLHGLAHVLQTNTASGLSSDAGTAIRASRIAQYGTNALPLPIVNSIFSHVVDTVSDPTLIILLVSGALSITINTARAPSSGWLEGVAILFAVTVVAIISSYSNWNQEVAFFKLAASLKGDQATVLRGGAQCAVDQDEILVGDVVCLSPGCMIPADGVVVGNATVRVNESSITGEADELTKTPFSPFLAAGTELVDGSCHMLVTAVGPNSTKGKLLASMVQRPQRTGLQERLQRLTMSIGTVGIICAGITFVALLLRFIIQVETSSTMTWSKDWADIIDFFIVAVAVVVIGIPEGLPLAVTVSLAYSMTKMREDQNLVKVLSACETMGNATTICSDKTGTLTQNKMAVVQAYLGGLFYPQQPDRDALCPAIHDLLVEGVVCNSDRRVSPSEMDYSVPPEDWKWEGDGGATESALLAWLSRYHVPPDHSDVMHLRAANRERVLLQHAFSSSKKYSSVIMLTEARDPSQCRRYYKGAADRVIKACTHVLDKDGNRVPVGSLALPCCVYPGCRRDAMRGPSADEPTKCDEHSEYGEFLYSGVCRHRRSDGRRCNKWAVMGVPGGEALYCTEPTHHPAGDEGLALLDQHPLKLMTNMTRVGLRCIAVAYVDGVEVGSKDGQYVDPEEVPGWTLVGFVGIKDPLRFSSRDAVMTVQQAGIIVRMVTGDNIDTARFIAEDCGIITHSRQVAIEGSDFRLALQSQEQHKAKTGEDLPEFLDLVKNLRVMARCQPEDKLELVKFLREHDQVVGVTGDGSNDGPALKEADVGLAMNIAGTDVAKGAADIVILDDDFASIVKSVMWGRCVYDNIRKFIQFQVVVLFSSIALALIAAIVRGETPLKPVQLLWLNLLMDTLGSLALSTENPKPVLLSRLPYRPNSNIVSLQMARMIACQVIIQLAILLTIFFAGKDWFDKAFYVQGVYNKAKHYTFIFNTFVWFQLFNTINSRKVNGEFNIFDGFFENPWFSTLFVAAAAVQFCMVEVLGSFASTSPQTWFLWLAAIGIGATQLLTGVLARFIPVPAHDGEIELDEETFEGAAWRDDPSLAGAMFHPRVRALKMRSATTRYIAAGGAEGQEQVPARGKAKGTTYAPPPGAPVLKI